MKYIVLAVLMFLLGALLTTFRPEPQPLIPVVRMRTPDGFFVTFVQDRVRGHQVCKAAIDAYVEPLKAACPACAVESSDCATKLVGIEGALAEDRQLPIYAVSAEGLRMSVVGPPRLVKEWCERLATQLVLKGLKSAACVFPPGGA